VGSSAVSHTVIVANIVTALLCSLLWLLFAEAVYLSVAAVIVNAGEPCVTKFPGFLNPNMMIASVSNAGSNDVNILSYSHSLIVTVNA
jgi:hypothetical protein